MAGRRRPFRRPRVLWLAPLLLTGCDCCEFFQDCPPDWRVSRVALTDTLFAEAAAEFELEARIKDGHGQDLEVAQSLGISIDWTSSVGDIFEDRSVNPVIVKLPAAMGGDVQIEAEVTWTWLDGEGDPHTTAFPTHTEVVVSPGAADAASDWVYVEHTPRDPPAAALIQGLDGSESVVDWPIGIVGSARLGRDLGDVTSSPNGPSEIVVFARDREMFLAEAPWSAMVDADPMPPPLFRELAVRIGLHEDTDPNRIKAADWVERAADLFNQNRVGIGLELVEIFQHSRRDDSGPLAISNETAACSNWKQSFSDLTTPDDHSDLLYDLTDAAEKVLYILFVPEIPPTLRGWACEPQANWESRLIYIGWDEMTPATMAHEIVHILSFMDPHIFGDGHTDGVEGFDESNLMWGQATEHRERAKHRKRLTLGQVYRMNLHDESWLNHVISAPIVRACEETRMRSGPCPALAADLGG